jgi:hypothetical protein
MIAISELILIAIESPAIPRSGLDSDLTISASLSDINTHPTFQHINTAKCSIIAHENYNAICVFFKGIPTYTFSWRYQWR